MHQILTLKTSWIFIKNYTAKPYSFLVIDATLTTGNHSHFRKILLGKIQELIMANDDKIDEKFQYDINRKDTKILSSEKTDKDDYLTSEEILSPNQRK